MPVQMEAIVVFRDTLAPVLEMDPIMLETREGLGIPTNDDLLLMLDAAIEYEANTGVMLALVWSDTLGRVEAPCVTCGDVYTVDDDMTADDDGLVCNECAS